MLKMVLNTQLTDDFYIVYQKLIDKQNKFKRIRDFSFVPVDQVEQYYQQYFGLLTKITNPYDKYFFQKHWVPVGGNDFLDYFIDLNEHGFALFEVSFIDKYWLRPLVCSNLKQSLTSKSDWKYYSKPEDWDSFTNNLAEAKVHLFKYFKNGGPPLVEYRHVIRVARNFRAENHDGYSILTNLKPSILSWLRPYLKVELLHFHAERNAMVWKLFNELKEIKMIGDLSLLFKCGIDSGIQSITIKVDKFTFIISKFERGISYSIEPKTWEIRIFPQAPEFVEDILKSQEVVNGWLQSHIQAPSF